MSEPYARVPDVNKQVEFDITQRCTPCSRGPAERMLKNDAPDPGSYPREYRGCSGIRFFYAFGPMPARHQAKDGRGPGRCLVHAICQVRPAAAHARSAACKTVVPRGGWLDKSLCREGEDNFK